MKNKRIQCSHTAVLFAVLFLFSTVAPAQTTWYVATNGSDTAHSGTGWTDAFQTISNAITKSASLDTILVGPGEYVLTSALSLTKNIHLLGAEGPSNTIINANHPAYSIKALDMHAGCVAGFTFTNGIDGGYEDGGAAYMRAGTIITNCIFTGNRARRYGGGVLVYGGVLSDCIVRGNEASYGGGVMVRNSGQVLNCLIENNSCVNYGGGCYVVEASVASNCVMSGNTAGTTGGGCELNADVGGLVTDCVISGNVAGTIGGGIRVQANSVLRNSIIFDNLSESAFSYAGGGVYLHRGGALVNCLIYGNQAPDGGGGGVGMSTPTSKQTPVQIQPGGIESCTIVGNTAKTAGGLCLVSSGEAGFYVSCRNTIIYSNTATEENDNRNVATFGVYTNCCTTPSVAAYGTGSITDDPLFVNASADNYRLQPGSPCVNTGLNQPWMEHAVDLDGKRRLDRASGLVDMGCYEHIPRGTLFLIQ